MKKDSKQKKKVAKKATPKKVVSKVEEKGKAKGKNKGGRPLFDGKDENIVLLKLEEAFKIGCTDEEACFNADISTTALYSYEKKNPKFRERKHRLKESPIFIARKSVVNGLEKDHEHALRFLERKKKDEFSPKMEVENRFAELDETIGKLKNTLASKKQAKPKKK